MDTPQDNPDQPGPRYEEVTQMVYSSLRAAVAVEHARPVGGEPAAVVIGMGMALCATITGFDNAEAAMERYRSMRNWLDGTMMLYVNAAYGNDPGSVVNAPSSTSVN